jgi:two-component system, cell cycle response regulator
MEMMSNEKRSYFGHTAPVFRVFSNEPLLSIADKLYALEILQQSLELKEMMDNFATLVATFIRPFNISFDSTYGFFSVSKLQESNYLRSFSLSTSGLCAKLGLMTYQSDTPFTVNDDKLLTELHKLLQPNLQHALKFSALNSMVYKDHLTNIGNRAYYEEAIFHAIEQSNRSNLGLSLMVIDIDNFKPINDTYGHSKGDQILNVFAQILARIIRTSDIAFRLGGDEFAIILHPATGCSVQKIRHRIKREIEKSNILKEVSFSASMGYSHWEMGLSAKQLFEKADENLYQNKALRRIQR